MKRIPFISTAIIFLVFSTIACKKQVKEEKSSVTFRTIELSEKHHLKDNDKNPLLNIDLRFQYPADYSDEIILKKIRKIMLADFLPDVVDTTDQPEAILQSYVNARIKIYESSERIILDEDLQEIGSQPESAWKDNTSLLIRYNTGGLLSYTVESNQFAGGAHGGNTYRNAIIDLKTGEKLREEDLFTESSIPLINNMILKKLELKNKVETPEELEQIGYFDVSLIGQYKNAYLTEDGIVYTFNEYEIAAYALGAIEVKLTFKDLEGFIAPGSPLEKIVR